MDFLRLWVPSRQARPLGRLPSAVVDRMSTRHRYYQIGIGRIRWEPKRRQSALGTDCSHSTEAANECERNKPFGFSRVLAVRSVRGEFIMGARNRLTALHDSS